SNTCARCRPGRSAVPEALTLVLSDQGNSEGTPEPEEGEGVTINPSSVARNSTDAPVVPRLVTAPLRGSPSGSSARRVAAWGSDGSGSGS
ncbi:MAG: hypothetical protein ACRDYE_09110, partial [Acidimicrobiales bacterium]